MNKKRAFLILYSLSVFILISCDPSGNVFLVNKYPFTIVAYIGFEYLGERIEKIFSLDTGTAFSLNARNLAYSYITNICIKTEEGLFLAEYSPEYILSIRNAYIRKRNQLEGWMITEKGLFFESEEIRKRFRNDPEGREKYYKSEEAAKELEETLSGRLKKN
ncbi:MAG: hypothetical protein LBK62_06310 [Treponema sp.]|jgi:hypothetical protein|nr:hypothetical protein [Treponema sp.]